MYGPVTNSELPVRGEAVMDSPRSAEHALPCETCPVRTTSFCQILLGPIAQDQSLEQHWEQVHRRSLLLETANPAEHLYAICEGWAFRFKRFKDGRRHILNFLVPGDFIYCAFTESPGYNVQALTDVRYCRYSRAGIEAYMLGNRQTLDALIARGIEERMQLAATSVALGRFDASGRIAHLVLQLRDRLAARGLASSDSCPFPLRQSHIADATGLTTVHVSRTIGAFRKDGVFAVEDGMLKIIDLAKLRRIGEG
jgi:CRP/FNR family transcriptional regulator